jgi:hypothetical protein
VWRLARNSKCDPDKATSVWGRIRKSISGQAHFNDAVLHRSAFDNGDTAYIITVARCSIDEAQCTSPAILERLGRHMVKVQTFKTK